MDYDVWLEEHIEWVTGGPSARRVRLRITRMSVAWAELTPSEVAALDTATGTSSTSTVTTSTATHLLHMLSIVAARPVSVAGRPALEVIAYPHERVHATCASCCSVGVSEAVAASPRVRVVHTFVPTRGDAHVAAQMAAVISALSRGQAPPMTEARVFDTTLPRSRSALVLINPVSGLRKGVAVWAQQCAPMLEDAGMRAEVIVSSRAREMTDIMRTRPWATLANLDAIIAVGGDGVMQEVLDGVFARPDWAALVRTCVFGLIPTGSGNGLVASLLARNGWPFHVSNATLMIAKGHITTCDISSTFINTHMSGSRSEGMGIPAVTSSHTLLHDAGHEPGEAAGVSTSVSPSASLEGVRRRSGSTLSHPHGHAHAGGDKTDALPLAAASASVHVDVADAHVAGPGHAWGSRHFSFLSLSWGIISDIDIESEVFRCCGPMRFEVYAVWRALALRKYSGRFSYLPVAPSQRSGRRWTAEAPTPVPTRHDAGVEAVHSQPPLSSAAAAAASTAMYEGTYELPACTHLTPFDTPPPLTWRVLEGVFTLLWVCNTSHQSIGLAGAPSAQHDDGVLTVTLVRNCSSMQMVQVLLGLDDAGNHTAHPAVESITCSAFRLEPEMDPALSHQGHIALDGEDMPYAAVQAQVHPGLMRIFGGGGGNLDEDTAVDVPSTAASTASAATASSGAV